MTISPNIHILLVQRVKWRFLYKKLASHIIDYVKCNKSLKRPRRVKIEPVKQTAFWKLVLIDYAMNPAHEIVKLNYARFSKHLQNQ